MVARPHTRSGPVRAPAAIFFILVFTALPQAASGSAWDEAPGHGQIILTTSYLATSRSFDSNWNSHLFPYNGTFRQFQINAFLDLGLRRRWDLLANVPFPFLRSANDYGSQESSGAGDIAVGLKYRLNSLESPWAISAQVLTQFPAYSATTSPPPGNHQEDIEARFLVGRGGKWLDTPVFWDAEVAYRYRTGAPADQFRADVTGGMNLTRNWMLMVQVFTITSMGNSSPVATTNPNAQSDFDLYKVQPCAVWRVAPRLRVQAGWTYAFAARNTSRDHTVLLALWKDF